MSVLGVHAGATGLHVVACAPDGRTLATAYAALVAADPGRAELAPETIWQATLQAVREVLTQVDPGSLTGIGVAGRHDTLVLWDHDTMGSPRAAMTGTERRAVHGGEQLSPSLHDRVEALTGRRVDASCAGPRLAWLAAHEPHTWALVETGRYAVGTVASYLVARMTRGLWHVADASTASGTLLRDLAPTGDWSVELCGVFGVPLDALPEPVATWGPVATTDPRVFLDLAVPLSALVAEPTAMLVCQAALTPDRALVSWAAAAGAPTVLVLLGEEPVRAAGFDTSVAWRSPTGRTAYLLESRPEDPSIAGLPSTVTSLLVEASADDPRCAELVQQARRAGLDVEHVEPGPSAALGTAYLAGVGDGLWTLDDLVRLRAAAQTVTPSTD